MSNNTTTPCAAGHTWVWTSGRDEMNYRLQLGTPCQCGAVVWAATGESVRAGGEGEKVDGADVTTNDMERK